MRRRRVLACCGLFAGVPIAGCTDGGGNGSADGDGGGSSNVYRSTFRESLTDEGATVHELETVDGRVEVVYSPGELPADASESDYEARVEETVQVAAKSFFDRVYGGWDVEGLDATVRVDGTVVATWRMERAWVDRYLDGELTREEMTRKVTESVERYDGTDDGSEASTESDDGTRTETGTGTDDGTGNDTGTGNETAG